MKGIESGGHQEGPDKFPRMRTDLEPALRQMAQEDGEDVEFIERLPTEVCLEDTAIRALKLAFEKNKTILFEFHRTGENHSEKYAIDPAFAGRFLKELLEASLDSGK